MNIFSDKELFLLYYLCRREVKELHNDNKVSEIKYGTMMYEYNKSINSLQEKIWKLYESQQVS